MSILKKVLNELSPYGEMGLPTGQGSQGIGNNDSQTKNTKLTAAYKLQKLARNHPDHHDEQNANSAQSMNDRLRHHARAEDEEEDGMNFDMGGGEHYPSDDEMGGMEDEMNQTSMNDMGDMDMGDVEMGMDDCGDVDVEEVKNFFSDNPSPSDEEIAQYAGERGIEMDQLRQEVYALIQSLLDVEGGEEMGMDDEMAGVDDMDGMDSGDDMSADEEDMGAEEDNPKTKFDFSSGVDDDEFEIRSKLR